MGNVPLSKHLSRAGPSNRPSSRVRSSAIWCGSVQAENKRARLAGSSYRFGNLKLDLASERKAAARPQHSEGFAKISDSQVSAFNDPTGLQLDPDHRQDAYATLSQVSFSNHPASPSLFPALSAGVPELTVSAAELEILQGLRSDLSALRRASPSFPLLRPDFQYLDIPPNSLYYCERLLCRVWITGALMDL